MNHSSTLKSMTAYGRGSAVSDYGRFTVEIQSVNRRFLEFNIALPTMLSRFESAIRKQAAAQIGRGMVSISVNYRFNVKQPFSITPNLPLAKQLKDAFESLAHHLNLDPKIDLGMIAENKDILLYENALENEAGTWDALNKALSDALEQFVLMKREEGSYLAKDLLERIVLLEKYILEIEAASSNNAERYRQRLSERLDSLFKEREENEERVLREIAVLAEKMDITEEIVRFKSHLKQFRELLEKASESETETRGKTLDFWIQELSREVNTIGSKALEKEISVRVVLIKSELEKIREQIQNIE